jgi:hypothetical protein
VLYQNSRPRGEHPIYEIDRIDRRHAVDTVPTETGGVQTIAKPLDEIAILYQEHAQGYRVGELDEARDRFLEMRDVDANWRLDG